MHTHTRRRGRLRLQLPAGPPVGSWGATAGAVLATALALDFLASGLTPPRARPEDAAAPGRAAVERSERVDYARIAPGEAASAARAAPEPERRGSAAAPPVAAPASPAAPRPAVAAPPDSLRRPPGGDRAPAAPAAAPPPRTPVAGFAPFQPSVSIPAAPSRRTGSGAASGCREPCADALTAGAWSLPAGLDSAGRADRLRELGASIPALAPERGDRVAGAATTEVVDPGGPPVMRGMSVSVPLPGGGPTRAQRERARRLDAENMAMMARVRARVDSAVADSLRRDSISAAARARRGRLPPPAPADPGGREGP